MKFEVGDRVIAKHSRKQGVVKTVSPQDGGQQRLFVEFDDPKMNARWFFSGHFEKAEIHNHVHWAPGGVPVNTPHSADQAVGIESIHSPQLVSFDNGPKCHGDDHVAPRFDGGCDACDMKGETKATPDNQIQYGDTVEYKGKEYAVTWIDSVTGLLGLGYLGPNGEFESHTDIHPDQVRYVDPGPKKESSVKKPPNDTDGTQYYIGDIVLDRNANDHVEYVVIATPTGEYVDVVQVGGGPKLTFSRAQLKRSWRGGSVQGPSDPGEDKIPAKLSGSETWDAANPRLSETWVEEAQRIVGGCRQEDYGDAEDMTAKIAAVWSQYLGVEVTPRQFCMLMVLLKVMRDSHKAKRDNPVDIHGYLILLEKNERGAK